MGRTELPMKTFRLRSLFGVGIFFSLCGLLPLAAKGRIRKKFSPKLIERWLNKDLKNQHITQAEVDNFRALLAQYPTSKELGHHFAWSVLIGKKVPHYLAGAVNSVVLLIPFVFLIKVLGGDPNMGHKNSFYIPTDSYILKLGAGALLCIALIQLIVQFFLAKIVFPYWYKKSHAFFEFLQRHKLDFGCYKIARIQWIYFSVLTSVMETLLAVLCIGAFVGIHLFRNPE